MKNSNFEHIYLTDKWEEEKINSNEILREIICYDIKSANKRADMMVIIENDGDGDYYVRVYNMDGDMFYDENQPSEKIPSHVLKRLMHVAEMQIRKDLTERIESIFDKIITNSFSEIDVYTELLEQNISVAIVDKFLNSETAARMKRICKKEGLL